MLNRNIYGRRICPYCGGEPGLFSQFDPQSCTYSVQWYYKSCYRRTKIYKDFHNGADAYRAAEKDFDDGIMLPK